MGEHQSEVQSERLAAASEGFTGAEIAEAVMSVLFQAFWERKRPVTEQDLATALHEGCP